MGEPGDDPPTAYAPTELGDIIEDTEAHTAWSLDDGEEWEPRRLTPARITALAVTAAVAAVAAAGVVYYVTVVSQPTLGDVQAVTPGMKVDAAPLPPVGPSGFDIPTVTVTAAPPSVDPASEVNPVDARLLNTLRNWGWIIDDPYEVVDRARRLCTNLHASGDVVAVRAQVVAEAAASGDRRPDATAEDLMNAAIGTYPNCP